MGGDHLRAHRRAPAEARARARLRNGMILLRIAKLCERYVGTDLSANAIDYVRDVITSHPDFILPHCELDIAGAHEAARFTDKHLDTVVCNGVSMYFPSADYLTSVVENSLTAGPPRRAFLSRRCSELPAARHFHASVQLFLADPGMTFHDYRINVATHVKHEKELLVDPVAFLAMVKRALSPSLCDRVVIDMRRGYHRTELECIATTSCSGAPTRRTPPKTAARGTILNRGTLRSTRSPRLRTCSSGMRPSTSPSPEFRTRGWFTRRRS